MSPTPQQRDFIMMSLNEHQVAAKRLNTAINADAALACNSTTCGRRWTGSDWVDHGACGRAGGQRNGHQGPRPGG